MSETSRAISALQFVAFGHQTPGGSWQIEFPQVDGCTTTAKSEASVCARALEALEAHLRGQLERGELPAWPQLHRPPKRNERRFYVMVDPGLAIAVQIRRMRMSQAWSQAELARLVGVSQQQIAKLENADGNPTLETVTKVARVFSEPLVLVFGKPWASASGS